jgi:hypothetical protein
MEPALTGKNLISNIKQDHVANKSFLGVFPIDRLPKISTYPASAIINTDTSQYKGEHWLAFYIDLNKKCTFFDSYGRSPSHFGLAGYFAKYSNKIEYNKYQYQSFNSASCGYYSIFFLKLISRGWNLKDLTRVLSKKYFLINDIFIETLIKKHLK